jgi:uncharacterized membrane protein
MLMLLAGLILFFAPHSVAVVAPSWRNRIVMHLRPRAWKGLYSLVSAAGLILMVLGFVHARRAPVVLYVSPAWLRDVTWVMMLPVFPLLIAAYLPGRIQRAAKHPMLAAIKLWATAHLLVNGTLADVLAPGAPPSRYNDFIALLLGLGLYVAFIYRLHGLIIGVPLLAAPASLP